MDQQEPSRNSLRVIFLSAGICATVFAGTFIYKRHFRRINTAMAIPSSFLRKKTIFGKVVNVGDADNFRLFHTPGGLLAGWGWLRKTQELNKRGNSDSTIHIRLCGVDAPEGAHFGRKAQPYSDEALAWLKSYLLGRRVRVLPLEIDQYKRCLGDVWVWKWNGRRNVSKEMLKRGWAVVYEAQGAEFNHKENEFRRLEKWARSKKIGMFRGKKLETPGEYKRRHRVGGA